MWRINFRVGPLQYTRRLVEKVTPPDQAQASDLELFLFCVGVILILAGSIAIMIGMR